MIKSYTEYHDRFHELYRTQIKEDSFSEWLYNRILDDIKDSLIEWHNLVENPDDLPESSEDYRPIIGKCAEIQPRYLIVQAFNILLAPGAYTQWTYFKLPEE